MSLKLASIIEKNRIAGSGPYLILLEIPLQTATIRLVNNNENIVWNNETWYAVGFEFGEVTYDGREIPSITLKISNVTREVGEALAQVKGGGGTEIIVREINAKLLDAPPEIEEYFIVQSSSRDPFWCTVTIGIEDIGQKRVNHKTVMKNFCSYLQTPGPKSGYGGIECGVSAATIAQFPTCPGTLAACRERNNSRRFGGEPGI